MKPVVVFLSGLLSLLLVARPAAASTRPNIVYVLADQWRASATGYAGDPNVRTPNLDRLAKEALDFGNAVSVCPVCTPYRAALMTGRFPTSTGMFLNDAHLPDNELCMAEIFKAAGYDTAYIGKWHLDGHGRKSYIPRERRQGWDYWKAAECDHNYHHSHYYTGESEEQRFWEGYDALAQTKDAQQYIRGRASIGQPFILCVAYGTPHFPHDTAPAEFKAFYPPEKIKLPPNVPAAMEARARKEAQGYYAHCSALDQCLGDLLATLAETGLATNTIFVFTSDHGEMLGSHGAPPFMKQVAWSESAQVPFLMRVPAVAGRVVRTPLTTPDILPTLLGLAGVEIPQTVEGEDLSSLIREGGEVDRAALYMNVAPFVAREFAREYRAIRTVRYTYVRGLEGPWMLFDDTKDPHQMGNLAGNPEQAALVGELEERLQAQLRRVGDQFRPGPDYIREWGYEIGPHGSVPYDKPGVKPQSPRRFQGDQSAAVAPQPATAVRSGVARGLTVSPKPTLADVRYGLHERQILDFWRAASGAPTPLVLVIHGGGWQGGEKERVNRFVNVEELLRAGISVVAINYRFIRHAEADGVKPPVKVPLHDAARALQFVRSKADEWHIDRQRIGAAGGSAGACSSLWLAFHDDLALPQSEDPVARESTRLWCAAVTGAQTTLDPQQMREWTPNSRYGGHAFGLRGFSQFLAEREQILPWIAEFSPYALLTADDPPVYLIYAAPPALGREQEDPTHTSNFGVKLQEHCAAMGVACELVYPGAPGVKHATPTAYLIAKLKEPADAAVPGRAQSSMPAEPEKQLPWPGEVFLVAGRTAFVIPAKGSAAWPATPWVWYAPTLPGLPGPEERWMFERFHDAGIAVAGMDVGESYGSPAGCALYSAFYNEMTRKRGYSAKPVLLGRSRGGLMTLSWAAANPDQVGGVAGIYPVCNLASYPGVATAAPAYQLEADQLQARLAEYNPVDRLAPLARAGVALFAIHGDSDQVVPLEANSGLVKERYTALGGAMQLIVPPGQGHNMWTGFFQCEELVNFVTTHARP